MKSPDVDLYLQTPHTQVWKPYPLSSQSKDVNPLLGENSKCLQITGFLQRLLLPKECGGQTFRSE